MIHIQWEMMTWAEGEFEVTDEELAAMAKSGVDVDDEQAVSTFYREHVGQEVHGVFFQSLTDISENWSSKDDKLNEVTEWWPNRDD